MTLTQLGPFNLPLTTPGSFPAAQFTILQSGQFSNSKLGQLAIYNYSNYLLSLYSSSDGFLLNLQPGTGNVYDPPSGGGSLMGAIIGGAAPTSGGSAYVTAQVDLDGGQILGSWPQTLSGVALPGSTNVNATQIQGVPVSATPPTPGQTLIDVGGVYVPGIPPYPSPVTARVHLAGSQTIVYGTATLIAYDTVDFDTNAAFNVATHKYVCPVAGYYQVYGQLSNANDFVSCQVFHNGANTAQGPASAVPYTQSGGFIGASQDLVLCAAGDDLELFGYSATNPSTTPLYPNTLLTFATFALVH